MPTILEELNSTFYKSHGIVLYDTYSHFSGKQLINSETSNNQTIIDIFNAPYPIVSHDTEIDPIFNFGNKIALDLFELTWEQFINLPSSVSAQPIEQEKRKALLKEVTQNGFINDYSGVRITSTGKRFLIEQAYIWNLVNDSGIFCGQAAMFKHWTFL